MHRLARVALAALLAVAGAWGLSCGDEASRQQSRLSTVTIAGGTWQVELAVTDERRAEGLSGRRSLGADEGMLFVFPEPQILSFWMRGCYISLDIAFLDADLRVISVQTMYAEPDQAGRQTYVSPAPAQYALEVRAGALGEAGVRPGHKAVFSPEIPRPAKGTPSR